MTGRLSIMDQIAHGLLAGGGWEGLEPDLSRMSADAQELINQAMREAEPVAKLFATPEGERVLLWLIRKTLLRPPSAEQATAATTEAYALACARREGQNAVIWMLLAALRTGRGEVTGGEA